MRQIIAAILIKKGQKRLKQNKNISEQCFYLRCRAVQRERLPAAACLRVNNCGHGRLRGLGHREEKINKKEAYVKVVLGEP